MAQIDKGVATSFKDATGAILTIQGTNAEEWWAMLTDVLTLGRFPDPESVARQIAQDCLGPYYRNGSPAEQAAESPAAAPMGTGVGPAPAAAPAPSQGPSPVPQPAAQMGGPPCPKCGQGQVVPKNRRDGSGVFYGCNRFPNCDYIQRG